MISKIKRLYQYLRCQKGRLDESFTIRESLEVDLTNVTLSASGNVIPKTNVNNKE